MERKNFFGSWFGGFVIGACILAILICVTLLDKFAPDALLEIKIALLSIIGAVIAFYLLRWTFHALHREPGGWWALAAIAFVGLLTVESEPTLAVAYPWATPVLIIALVLALACGLTKVMSALYLRARTGIQAHREPGASRIPE
jgi:hypothetical protein